MEKIIEITEFDTGDGWRGVAGYKVITNKQEIELSIDNGQSCCETFGFFWCNDNPQDFVGAKVRGISLTDTELNEAKMKQHDIDPSSEYFEGGVMFVNIDTNKGILQFVAHNEHNGYYGHDAYVKSTQLTHEEML